MNGPHLRQQIGRSRLHLDGLCAAGSDAVRVRTPANFSVCFGGFGIWGLPRLHVVWRFGDLGGTGSGCWVAGLLM